MILQTRSIVILLLLQYKAIYAINWPTDDRYSELNVALQGFTLQSFKVEGIFECYRKCEENRHCASINLLLTNKTCELKHSTKKRHPTKIVEQQNVIYMEIRDDLTPGAEPDNPIVSCKHLKQNYYFVKSGVYWMKFNEPSSAPFQVFCDMTTHGGGWTLVYSYTFTNFMTFNSHQNAVTPIPNWPINKSSGRWVPQSTTIPLTESSRSAMNFGLWKKIGSEFLVKSNITNWVACVEGTGSLVNFVVGSVTCRVVKAITSTCTTVTPNRLGLHPTCGLSIAVNSNYYMFLEGRTDDCFPVHDPCGSIYLTTNHVTSAASPGGAIYIR